MEQQIGGVERQGLVDIVRQQDDTPVDYTCWLRTKIILRSKLTCTFLYTPAHTQTGMRATKVKVEHMEDRLYIHRIIVYKI